MATKKTYRRDKLRAVKWWDRTPTVREIVERFAEGNFAEVLDDGWAQDNLEGFALAIEAMHVPVHKVAAFRAALREAFCVWEHPLVPPSKPDAEPHAKHPRTGEVQLADLRPKPGDLRAVPGTHGRAAIVEVDSVPDKAARRLATALQHANDPGYGSVLWAAQEDAQGYFNTYGLAATLVECQRLEAIAEQKGGR